MIGATFPVEEWFIDREKKESHYSKTNIFLVFLI